jgi:RNA polymerase sporulation-specific sigma factor
MFLSGTLIWLIEHGWLMFLHLSAKSSFPKPLPPEEEQMLIGRLAEGDKEAAQKLIEHNLRLVAHIVKKYARTGTDADDMISIGSIGLIKAVHTFRPEAGKLTTYASRCIENEIRMYLRAGRKNRGVVLLGDSIGTDKEGNELMLSDLVGTDPNVVPDEVEISIESRRAMQLMQRVLDEREIAVLTMRYGLEDGEPLPQHAVAKALDISRSYV